MVWLEIENPFFPFVWNDIIATKSQCTCLIYFSSAVVVALMMHWEGTGETTPFQLEHICS